MLHCVCYEEINDTWTGLGLSASHLGAETNAKIGLKGSFTWWYCRKINFCSI